MPPTAGPSAPADAIRKPGRRKTESEAGRRGSLKCRAPRTIAEIWYALGTSLTVGALLDLCAQDVSLRAC